MNDPMQSLKMARLVMVAMPMVLLIGALTGTPQTEPGSDESMPQQAALR